MRRPGERRDPYAAVSVGDEAVDSSAEPSSPWLWVPALRRDDGGNLPEIGWRGRVRICETAAMKATAKNIVRSAPSDIAARVDAIDWAQATSRPRRAGLRRPEGTALAGRMPRAGRALSGRHAFPQPDRDGPPRLRPRRVQVFCLSAAGPDRAAAARALRAASSPSPIAGTRRWGSTSAIPTATRRS